MTELESGETTKQIKLTTEENQAEFGRNLAPGDVHNVFRNVLRDLVDLKDHHRVRLNISLGSAAAAETKSYSM